MKFTVNKSGCDIVDVKLHWTSKDKIKKVLGYGLLFTTSALAGRAYTKINNKKNQE